MYPSPSANIDFRTALARLCDGPTSLAPLPHWRQAIEQLGAVLGAAPADLAAFTHAWRTLYSATLLLDHVQDGDAIGDPWLASLPVALQYHLAFSAYATAQRQLHELVERVAPVRGKRLHDLWSSAVLELAVGQYHDLMALHCPLGSHAGSLDVYERIAAQKTGAAFGLALGAVAALATDDVAQIDAAANAGLVFGMLLQYGDDLADAEAQAAQPAALTLARAWTTTQGNDLPEIAPSAAWGLIYAHYHQALGDMLTPLPERGRAVIWALLHDTFGVPTNPGLRTSGASPGPVIAA